MTRFLQASFALLVAAATTEAFAPCTSTMPARATTQHFALPDAHGVFEDGDKYTIKATTQPTRLIGGGGYVPPADVYSSNDPAMATSETTGKEPLKQCKPGLNSDLGQMTQC